MATNTAARRQGVASARPAEADLEQLGAAIAEMLRRLPLGRAGFEARTRPADWVFLNAWPIGPDLEPAVRQRALSLAFELLRWRDRDAAGITPGKAARAVVRRFLAFAKAWQGLPEGARQPVDWRLLAFSARSAVKAARLSAETPHKEALADRLAETFQELTGRGPAAHGGTELTGFEALVRDVFELGKLGSWRAAAKHAATRWTKNRPKNSG
jgi:hypothetical protein